MSIIERLAECKALLSKEESEGNEILHVITELGLCISQLKAEGYN